MLATCTTFSKGLLFTLLWLGFSFLSLSLFSCFAIFSRASFAPPRQVNLTSCTFIAFPLVFDTSSTLPPWISFHATASFPLKKSKQRCNMVSSSCNTLLHSGGLEGRSLRLGAPSLGKHEFKSFRPQPWAVINTCTTAELCFLLKALSSHLFNNFKLIIPSFPPCLSIVPVSKQLCLGFSASLHVPQGDGTTGTPRPTKAASPAASAWFNREVSASGWLVCVCKKS